MTTTNNNVTKAIENADKAFETACACVHSTLLGDCQSELLIRLIEDVRWASDETWARRLAGRTLGALDMLHACGGTSEDNFVALRDAVMTLENCVTAELCALPSIR